MKEAYFARLMEEKDKGIGLFLKYHNTLCFPSTILQSSQRKLKQYLCKLLKGRQRVVRYVWKRRIELKTSRFLAKAKIDGENYFQQRKVYQWGRLKEKRFLSDANRSEMRHSDDLFQKFGQNHCPIMKKSPYCRRAWHRKQNLFA